MIRQWQHVRPFVTANTSADEPIDSNAWLPKLWSPNGWCPVGLPVLHDDTVDFVAAGIVPGDLLFVVWSGLETKSAHTVQIVNDPHSLSLSGPEWPANANIVYKVGKKQQHTIATLADIIAQRLWYSYSILYQTLWTPAPFVDFARDQYGDVYCIF